MSRVLRVALGWRVCERAFVMYVISDPSQPHVALGVAATLEGIADALAARSEPDLEV
jgi:hypothetical protein